MPVGTTRFLRGGRAHQHVAILLTLAATLAGCGDLPRPFMGNPGINGRRLAAPPPARLAVPVPPAALLGDEASAAFAKALADALANESIPAFAGNAHPGDWRIAVTATMRDGQVVPTYTVQNPKGEAKGSVDGTAVAAAVWAAGDKAAIDATAADAAPRLDTLMTRILAAYQQADPNSLVNRPARVMVGATTGAPGDGDTALPRQLTQHLSALGEVVQDSKAGADFVVTCQVHTAPGAGNTTRIEIQWIVSDPNAGEVGRIVQINEVPPGSLDKYWGDVADVVAQQAAGGVREVILNQLASHRLEKQGTPDAATGASAGAASAVSAGVPAGQQQPPRGSAAPEQTQ